MLKIISFICAVIKVIIMDIIFGIVVRLLISLAVGALVAIGLIALGVWVWLGVVIGIVAFIIMVKLVYRT